MEAGWAAAAAALEPEEAAAAPIGAGRLDTAVFLVDHAAPARLTAAPPTPSELLAATAARLLAVARRLAVDGAEPSMPSHRAIDGAARPSAETQRLFEAYVVIGAGETFAEPPRPPDGHAQRVAKALFSAVGLRTLQSLAHLTTTFPDFLRRVCIECATPHLGSLGPSRADIGPGGVTVFNSIALIHPGCTRLHPAADMPDVLGQPGPLQAALRSVTQTGALTTLILDKWFVGHMAHWTSGPVDKWPSGQVVCWTGGPSDDVFLQQSAPTENRCLPG